MKLYRIYATRANIHNWINVVAENEKRAKKLHPDFKGNVICLGSTTETEEKVLGYGAEE